MKFIVRVKAVTTVDLANDENDDWLKKADPKYREFEKDAHDNARKHKNRRKK